MEARGRLGNLLFQYSSVVGLCIQRGYNPNTCASITPVEASSIALPFNEFQRVFNIPTINCQSNGKHFEHLGDEGGIGYDHSLMSQSV